MMKCDACNTGGLQERLVHEYVADALGAPFQVILIDSVKEYYCAECNKKLKTSIPDVPSLLKMVAAARSIVPQKLSGAEIKFMRHAIGLKAKQVAKSLDMSPENFSRVENGTKVLGPQSERIFRVGVILQLIEEKVLDHESLSRVTKAFNVEIETFWDSTKTFEIYMKHTSVDENSSSEGSWVDKVSA